MKGSDLLVKCLENEGVKHIFGIPGEENLDLMDSLIGSNIEFVLTRHESSAAFMAGMVGRLTQRPGVCLSTLGPGASNMVIGVGEAYLGYYPMVALSGQVRTEQQRAPRKQYIDLVSMFKPITKSSFSFRDPNSIPELARKAFATATTERPGPVFVELPEDVLKSTADARPCPTVHEAPAAADFETEAIRKLLINSKKPLILSGQGVIRGRASEELTRFASAWNIPVAMTWLGTGTMSCENPLSLGLVGLRKADLVRGAFEEADLVILVGFDTIEFEPQFWNIGAPKKVVYMGAAPCDDVPGLQLDLQVLGDVRQILMALNEHPRPRVDWASGYHVELDRAISALPEDSSPVKPQQVIHAIRDALGRDGIVVSDVGAHLIWMAQRYPVYGPSTALLSNGLLPMGVGVPWAIAAKLTHPDRKVVASVGDGSFLMTSMELETAKRLGTPFVVVVWNDSEYGLIKLKQERAFGRGRSIGTRFNNPDVVKFAESLGAEGYRVSSAADLKEALTRSLNDDSLAVIDVVIDHEENSRLKIQ